MARRKKYEPASVQYPIYLSGQGGFVEPAAKYLDASNLPYEAILRWGDHEAGEGNRLTCTLHIVPDDTRARTAWEWYVGEVARQAGHDVYWLIDGGLTHIPGYPDARAALVAVESGAVADLRGAQLIVASAE